MKIALVHPGPVGCGQAIELCDCTCSHCSGPVVRCECHCGHCGGALHTACHCAKPHVIPAGSTPRVQVFTDEYVGGTAPGASPYPRPRKPLD